MNQKRKGKNAREKRRDIKILIFLILALLVLNYPFLDDVLTNFLNTNKEVHVDRIIDGDTLEAENGSIRLLGINTPERGEQGYEEAKDFLEDGILNKTVRLEFIGDRYDKYGRLLAYIFLENRNINVRMVEEGFANYYFYGGKDKYSDDLLNAWNTCIEKEVNLCEKSENLCVECVNIGSSGDFIINNCGFSCNISGWQIRGEGREKFIFSEQTLQPGADSNFALDLTNTGGSLFLRDEGGKLVKWKEG